MADSSPGELGEYNDPDPNEFGLARSEAFTIGGTIE